jgi:hypothetical protein
MPGRGRIRHVEEGLRGSELRDAVNGDLARAARLLETGLWSFNVLAHGAGGRRQLSEAASAAEHGGKQVVSALRRAREGWRLRQAGKDLTPQERREAKRGASKAGKAAWKAARDSKRSVREAHAIPSGPPMKPSGACSANAMTPCANGSGGKDAASRTA